MFEGKKILVGITAGIAAYKSILLVRLLKKHGADVRVVLTPSALEFVTPLTLSTLSGHPVISDFTVDKDTGEWTNHVELGLWPDLMIIAPLTANSLAKMVHGESDNFLLTTYLSAKCKVLVAPAMDLDMYQHPSTKANLDLLTKQGVSIIPVGTGALASGLEGEGRMAEPESIVEAIRAELMPASSLSGKSILITAGPTQEAIDPVRFISNHSTGKMGFRLAEEAVRHGMKATLVAGPTKEPFNDTGMKVVRVKSAAQMLEACMNNRSVDVVMMAAAVADYTPETYSDHKIKKGDGSQEIRLKRTTDILKEFGDNKAQGQILIGFAMETNNEEDNAKRKLESKNLDFIVLNKLNQEGAGFAGDTNAVTVFTKDNNIHTFELKSKRAIARDIFELIANSNA